MNEIASLPSLNDLLSQNPNLRPASLEQFATSGEIGTGLGSASAINNAYLRSGEILNPRANIIRLLYENGLIGTLFFISAFVYPIKYLRLPKYIDNKMILSTLFILGAFFAHRSSVPYIFLGSSLVILNQWSLINNRVNFIRG